jgi:ribosomal-protein-alanine N-acetyltransferase
MIPVRLDHQQKQFVLRAMQDTDLNAILVIENSAQAHPWTDAHFRSSLTSSHQCYVLEECSVESQCKRHALVAYAITSTAADEAELLNITVSPLHQRQGLGQLLLTQISESFNDSIHTLFLEVRASNSNAIALYDALYFNEVGERPNYYPSKNGRRENAIIMAKPLSM